MIVSVRKKTLMSLALIVTLLSVTYRIYDKSANYLPAFSSADGNVIVIDAGHGGEDGGAVGENNVLEKDINLKVAKKLEKILTDNGYTPVMTRVEDVSIYSNDEDSIRNKKRSDLKNRLKIMNESNALIFVSIHMNKFEQSKYRGGQVFYSTNNENSKLLGEKIQARIKGELESSQNREAKAAGSNIYILKKATIPAVIVECGFLSNPEDLKLLQTDEYQQRVAQTVYNGISDYFDELSR